MSQHETHNPHDGTGHAEAHAVHIVPLKIYFAVYGALLVLTALTVTISFIPLGFMNVPVALGIATLKATIVALFFMHLLYDDKFNALVFVMGLVFLGVFISMTLIDPMTRGQVYRAEFGPIHPPTLIRAAQHAAPENPASTGVPATAENTVQATPPASGTPGSAAGESPRAPEYAATEGAKGQAMKATTDQKASADAVLAADTATSAAAQTMQPAHTTEGNAAAAQQINDSPTPTRP